ncbi:MAG: phage/plasmid primase, P4 family, partial [Desulfobacterales bacterium]|nr:phage/plasmid primase, P4 family [Desulfobacterales bacterium]
MYDVLNDKLLPHDPQYNSSIQVNITYNPSAECPKINKFLSEILDPGDIPPIIQLAGYCFTTDIKMQKAGLFVGGTENGKSTFLEMLSHGIGQENVAEQSIQALNSDKWARAQLQGKLVNIFPDLPKQKLYDNSVFKMLTTDQWIDGEEKYLKPFRFRNITKQIYSANQVPALYDPDEAAFFRRWLIFLFPNTFNEQEGNKKANKNIINEITTETELAGFFNLSMEGLRFLLKNHVFAYLRTDADVKKLYLLKSSPVASFMDECVVYSEIDCPKQLLYEDYCDWCKVNDVGATLKNNMFGKELKKLGYEDEREHTDQRQYVWKNVCSVWDAVQVARGTRTDLNPSTSTYFDLIRLGSRVGKDIVGRYRKIYTHYYDVCIKNTVGNRECTVEPGNPDGFDKIVSPDIEKSPSMLEDEPGGTRTGPKMTTCDYCKKPYPEDEITTDPSGKKWICHTCQIELISKFHKKKNQSISSQLDAVKLIRDTINNLSEGGITKISDTIIQVSEAGITADRF